MVLSEHCMAMWLFPLAQDCLAQHFLMSILPISEPISQLEIFFLIGKEGCEMNNSIPTLLLIHGLPLLVVLHLIRESSKI